MRKFYIINGVNSELAQIFLKKIYKKNIIVGFYRSTYKGIKNKNIILTKSLKKLTQLIEKKYNQEALVEGQIIRFLREDGTAVVHRVRADYGDTVYVQGDSLKEGEIITKEQITHLVLGVLYT